MRAKEFILETPLPADWDKSTYSPNVSFAKRIKYAQERAAEIGSGSARIAFEIPYEGRPTILKVAKNHKGIAQNNFESRMLNDRNFINLGISIPLIDHDEENEHPTWIHTEKAEPMTLTQFKKFFNGLEPYEMIEVAKYGAGFTGALEDSERYDKIIKDNKYISSVITLIDNFNIGMGDLGTRFNWGVYKNKPVLIDIGGSSEVMNLHY